MRDATPLLAPAREFLSEPAPETITPVLESRTFEKTPKLRELLAYLWQHRDEPISEYAIATEALGRSPLFDAKTDATVRVQISRLRQRLEKFYEEEGRNLEYRLTIPLGSHQIQLEHRTGMAAATLLVSPPEKQDDSSTVTGKRKNLAALLTVILLVICAVETTLLLRPSHRVSTGSASEIPEFWQGFFQNNRSTRIILPTPTFFSFQALKPGGKASVMLRDTDVNEWADRKESPSYMLLERMYGTPMLAENYTVTSDTFASIQLARYLDRFGLSTTVHSSADAPLQALDTENTIALGTWGTLTPLRPYLEQMRLRLSPHEDYVEVRSPRPGEPRRIEGVTESPDRGVWPGVIAFLPGASRRTHLLVLASRHTFALVSFLTSTNGLNQLEKIWKRKGSPEYFELVVNAELSGRGLVRVWPVVLYPFQPAA